jgi:hypothetical protein
MLLREVQFPDSGFGGGGAITTPLSLDAARAQLRALVGMGRGEVGRRRTAYGASFSAQAC